MKKKIFLILTLIFCLVFVISSVNATDLNSTDTPVETNLDDEVISTDVSGSFSNLRTAIDISNDITLRGFRKISFFSKIKNKSITN